METSEQTPLWNGDVPGWSLFSVYSHSSQPTNSLGRTKFSLTGEDVSTNSSSEQSLPYEPGVRGLEEGRTERGQRLEFGSLLPSSL